MQLAPRQAAAGVGRPLTAHRPRVPLTSSTVMVPVRSATAGRAPQATAKPQDGLVALSASMGMPTDEGLFGFRPFAETWCGRLAMMGFLISMIEEFLTGQGTLAQMRLMDAGAPNIALLAVLLAVFGGVTVYASVDTLQKLRTKKMTARDVARYKNFLALNNEDASAKAAAAMKRQGDFTSLRDEAPAIAAAKAAGSPVDAFLSTNELTEGETAAREMKSAEASPTSQPLSDRRADVEEAFMFGPGSELAYARDVELRNGRWAMLGFLAAVLVEAGTGYGIIGQGVMWLKLTGFLGPDSGF